jgi:hypothetical protein
VLLKIEITIQFCRIQKVQEPFFSVSTEFLAMAFSIKVAKSALSEAFPDEFNAYRKGLWVSK